MNAARRPLVAGNWKMYKTVAEAKALAADIVMDLAGPTMAAAAATEAGPVPMRPEVVLAPPYTALAAVAAVVADTPLGVAAQDMYWQPQGAFTGEISPVMVAELVDYVILGHSERRALFAESDADVGLKVAAALAHGLIPIVCVGETWAEREAGATDEVVRRQLTEALTSWSGPVGHRARRGADSGEAAEVSGGLVIAYEPVWAIGTGRACEPEEAQRVASQVRLVLAGRLGADEAVRMRILYGGSVNPGNAAAYLALAEIDGALVGGASLDVSAFGAIVRAAL